MKNNLLFLCILLLSVLSARAQQFDATYRYLFYNTENFFDPADNPDTEDDEYTPAGKRHWSYGRMKQKYNNLAKVIVAAGEGNIPALVGLAEVENDSCIYRLLHSTPLYDWNYRSVITTSQDRRGINIALLYQPDDYRLLGWEAWRIVMPEPIKPTRDILHAWGRVVGGDTVDVVICHLPSRLGGASQSAPARKASHEHLFASIDSLKRVRTHFHLIVMGDMNDYPNDIFFPKDCDLNNLMKPLQKALQRGRIPYGSHKYQGEWGFLDQIWVNESMCDTTLSVWVDNPSVFALPFMLTEDNTHLGHRPLRSYYGYSYEAGFSDHLPIKVDVHIKYK